MFWILYIMYSDGALFKTSYIGWIVSYKHNKEMSWLSLWYKPRILSRASHLSIVWIKGFPHTHTSSQNWRYPTTVGHRYVTWHIYTRTNKHISTKLIKIWSHNSTPYANSVEINSMILPIWRCWRWIAIGIECIIYSSLIFSSSESNEISKTPEDFP